MDIRLEGTSLKRSKFLAAGWRRERRIWSCSSKVEPAPQAKRSAVRSHESASTFPYFIPFYSFYPFYPFYHIEFLTYLGDKKIDNPLPSQYIWQINKEAIFLQWVYQKGRLQGNVCLSCKWCCGLLLVGIWNVVDKGKEVLE